MAKRINQRTLRNDNAKVIDEVVAGETFVVTRSGEPVAELRPYKVEAGEARRTFVRKEELLQIAARSPRIDLARFRADIDADVDPYVDDPYTRKRP